jgi:uncharacterized protein YqeY
VALKELLMNDMKAALLGGNRFEGEVLRGLKAAILNEEVATNKRDEGLADAEIEKVIAREIKKRRESAKLYRDNGRDDLAEPEEQEAAVLEKYLPEQMGEDEIRTLVQNAIKTLGASGPQAMGQVIGAVKAQAGNSADGATIAAIVKQELQT